MVKKIGNSFSLSFYIHSWLTRKAVAEESTPSPAKWWREKGIKATRSHGLHDAAVRSNLGKLIERKKVRAQYAGQIWRQICHSAHNIACKGYGEACAFVQNAISCHAEIRANRNMRNFACVRAVSRVCVIGKLVDSLSLALTESNGYSLISASGWEIGFPRI